MKRPFLTDYILYSLAKFFSALFTAMPVDAALGVGRFCGGLAYIFNRKRARIAYANMRAAFCAEKSPSEIRRLLIRLYENFGQTLIEVLRMPKVDEAYIKKYVSIKNISYLNETRARGRGVIFLTGHFGNWELSSVASVFTGFPLLVLAREQKMSLLNGALNALRESKGCRVIKKVMATREIFDHLRENGIVGILSDQDAGKRGLFVDFFGRPTSMARGAFALSQKTGAVIIPTFMKRRRGPYQELILEKPIEVGRGDAGVLEAVKRFASILERRIREAPDQWLWLHKRWKSTPLRKTVVLSDGKRGHLNQSLAVFEAVKECRRRSRREADTELKVIEVRYKTRAHRVFLDALSAIFSGYALWRSRCLKLCLNRESYEGLSGNYADIVISCGSGTAGVNLLFGRENNAKGIVIMRPGALSSANFDLAVIPEHDNPPARKNIVATLGAPNLITRERLESGLKSLEVSADLGGKKSVGLLVGGDNKYYALGPVLMKAVSGAVAGAARELDMNVLATSSRRTSEAAAGAMKSELEKSGLARLIITASERGPKWAVAGILAASEVVVVSGESSSMVSEAVSSSRPVIVFRPARKPAIRGNNRHEFFLRGLESKGLIRISTPGDLKKDIIEAAASGTERPAGPDDYGKILEAIKGIL